MAGLNMHLAPLFASLVLQHVAQGGAGTARPLAVLRQQALLWQGVTVCLQASPPADDVEKLSERLRMRAAAVQLLALELYVVVLWRFAMHPL